jgi:ribonuclease H-related protein
MKFYAVKKGRRPGIYITWDECKQQVSGHSGAVFKSFKTKQEAKEYIKRDSMSSPSVSSTTAVINCLSEPNSNVLNSLLKKSSCSSDSLSRVLSTSPKGTTVNIYTDGSHLKHKNCGYIGYGAYCKHLNKEYCLSGHVNTEKLLNYGITTTHVSNPTAEFIGFTEVLRKLHHIDNEINVIFHIDYIGVQKWISGEWKANKDYIRKIKDICLTMLKISRLKVQIKHVPGHTGVYGNEYADKMAKSQTLIDDF